VKRLWKWLLMAVALAIAALAVVVLSAGAWLETPAGRKLLQRELGNGLGLQAHLAGEYQLKIFPELQIAGERLVLQMPDAAERVGEIQNYEAHLALWPLLRKEILVHELALHHGSLDVGLLAAIPRDNPQGQDRPMQLPRIEAVAINDLLLYQSGVELLEIVQLSLQDFAAGENALLTLAVRLPGGEVSGVLVELGGRINVQPDPVYVAVQVEQLAATLHDERWPLGMGELSWSSQEQALSGNMRGSWGEFTGFYDFSLATGQPVRIRFGLQLESERAGALEAQLEAHEQSGTWLTDLLELNLGGQRIEGSGCLDTLGGTGLQLELTASQLDLDALQEWVPEGVAGQEGSTPYAGFSAPFPLAIRLHVDDARVAGAVARDVNLLIGELPECEAVTEAGSGSYPDSDPDTEPDTNPNTSADTDSGSGTD
jgi:hypothetical protein